MRAYGTSKGEILKSMLRHPEMSKVIKGALSSPVGSTSRAQAKRMFKIMGKLHSSRDGVGGPGIGPGMLYGDASQGLFAYQPSELTAGSNMRNQTQPPVPPKGMVIFNRIPKPNINFSNNGRKTPDGVGGPGLSNLTVGLDPNLLNMFSTPIGGSLLSQYAPNLAASRGYTPISLTPPQSQSKVIYGGNALSTGFTSPSSAILSPNILGGITPKTTTSTPSVTYKGILSSLPQGLPSSGPVIPSGLTYSGQAPRPSTSTILPPVSRGATASWALPTTPLSTPRAQVAPMAVGPQSRVGDTTPAMVPVGATRSFTDTGQGLPGSSTPQGGVNTAAQNIASFLGVQPNTPLSSIPINSLMQAIATNEGYTTGTSTPAFNNNNPGNLKFAGQSGAVQGSAATDGGYFAKFASVQDGWSALQNDLESKYASGKYTTLSDLMAVYSPDSGISSGPTKYSGLLGAAASSVEQNTGAGMFALNQLLDPNNPFTGGKTLGAALAANQKSIWDKYNVGGLQKEEARLREESLDLPQNVTAYITARDKYLVQTDRAIDRFIEDSFTGTDMSNPANSAKAKAHLDYLYTLRGRQNQSYVGYLNDAVAQHNKELTHVSNMYKTALDSYERDLKSENAITESQYTLYAAALADMYTAVEGAPLKALQLQAYQQQILDAHMTAVADATKKSAQGGFIEQGNKLQGYVWDSNHMVMPGTNLVKVIQDFSALDPSITPENIIQTYAMGVNNYLNTPNNEKDITPETKRKTAEEAIRQFARLSVAGGENTNTVLLGQSSANDIAENLATQISQEIISLDQVPKMTNAIQSFAPTTWFGTRQPPTVARFITNFAGENPDSLQESIAKAIYATLQRFVSDGGTPAAAVNSLLYATSSTADRDANIAYTPEQFAQNIGTIYAANILNEAFGT